MAVFGSNMNRIDPANVQESLKTIENYIHYMIESIEFANRNSTRGIAEAGVSSAELYNMVVELSSLLASLSSSVNLMAGTIVSIQGDIKDLDDRVTALEEN